MQELPSYFCASLCQVLEATAIQHLQAFPFNLHASLCQRLEATCTPHLQAPSSNLCASLCQRLEATGSTGTKHLQAVASNISAYPRQRLEATCKKRFMNSDTLWHVPMLLLANCRLRRELPWHAYADCGDATMMCGHGSASRLGHRFLHLALTLPATCKQLDEPSMCARRQLVQPTA